MDRGKEINLEVVGVSEAGDKGISDNFPGPQQCMNAFDLLQPTIKRQLESGTGVYIVYFSIS